MMVNLHTYWCNRCELPTLHRQTDGLDDGELYTILTCEQCFLQVKPDMPQETDFFGNDYI